MRPPVGSSKIVARSRAQQLLAFRPGEREQLLGQVDQPPGLFRREPPPLEEAAPQRSHVLDRQAADIGRALDRPLGEPGLELGPALGIALEPVTILGALVQHRPHEAECERGEDAGDRALAKGGVDLSLGRLLLVEVQVHDVVVEVGHCLDQVVAMLRERSLPMPGGVVSVDEGWVTGVTDWRAESVEPTDLAFTLAPAADQDQGYEGLSLAEATDAKIVPVDSEHTALHQLLARQPPGSVERLTITASGGPFRGRTDLSGITPDQALAHPTWQMGTKNTIDSASLMNKGLELIEASRLFRTPGERLQVAVHPQSIAHGFVVFTDGSVKGQLCAPDMRVPIGYALSYPDRLPRTSLRPA